MTTRASNERYVVENSWDNEKGTSSKAFESLAEARQRAEEMRTNGRTVATVLYDTNRAVAELIHGDIELFKEGLDQEFPEGWSEVVVSEA